MQFFYKNEIFLQKLNFYTKLLFSFKNAIYIQIALFTQKCIKRSKIFIQKIILIKKYFKKLKNQYLCKLHKNKI